jgi:hypothetical protein
MDAHAGRRADEGLVAASRLRGFKAEGGVMTVWGAEIKIPLEEFFCRFGANGKQIAF